MLNWFGKTQDVVGEKRFTRFEVQHTREPSRVAERHSDPHSFEQEMPRVRAVDYPQPALSSAAAEVPKVNLAEHLHSDDKISTSLLRRALPQRFADLDEEKMAASGQDQDELRFAFG